MMRIMMIVDMCESAFHALHGLWKLVCAVCAAEPEALYACT